MKCSKCGHTTTGEMAFCPECGQKLTTGSTQQGRIVIDALDLDQATSSSPAAPAPVRYNTTYSQPPAPRPTQPEPKPWVTAEDMSRPADGGYGYGGGAMYGNQLASATPKRHAGFWIRAGAAIIDGIIVGIVSLVVRMFITAIAGKNAEALSFIIEMLGSIAYYVYFEASVHQATFGKRAVGLVVVNERYERISVGQAFGRYFAKILSALILFIGYMMAGWTEKKQCLHDKLAGTYVVYK